MRFGWSVQSKAGATAQPLWSYPPPFGDEKGFGVEPSNVRSSAAPYAETLLNYLSFQQVVQGATYASWPELPSFWAWGSDVWRGRSSGKTRETPAFWTKTLKKSRFPLNPLWSIFITLSVRYVPPWRVAAGGCPQPQRSPCCRWPGGPSM